MSYREEGIVPGQEHTPEGLASAGRALYGAVLRDVDAQGAELRPDQLAVLTQACATEDVIARLAAELRRSEIIGEGSRGQPVVVPVVAELRQQRDLLGRLLARIGLDTAPAEEEQVPPSAAQVSRSARASYASRQRWHRGESDPGRVRPIDEDAS